MENLFGQSTIQIETNHSTLCLSTNQTGQLVSTYFGKKLRDPKEYPIIQTLDKFKPGNDDLYNQRLAYATSGTTNLLEPALAVTHQDGNNSVELHYKRHEVKQLDNNQTLTTIWLNDPRYALSVKLYYKAFKNEDVIEQWAEILNNEAGSVTLQKFASACMTFNGNKFFLKSHHGGWGQEMQSNEQQLGPGIYTIDSKLGTRNNLLHSSSFMLSLDQEATETSGEVIAASLAWSGNFKIDFETFDEYYLRITAGINPFASAYNLAPGKSFITPPFVFSYSDQGKGQVSRNLHNWARRYQIRNGLGKRLTLLNNWETTYFDFDEPKLKSLLSDTKKLGVDLFLLDDGWFGNKYPRNGANTALGDWQANRQKLPHDIAGLVREAAGQQIKFGIWLEPEMVSPKSALYENHPDWVVRQPNLPEYYMRNQLVLDLSNPEVQDFIVRTVDSLFEQAPNLAFIKWDCNSLIYNAHSATLANQNHFYIDYTKGLYAILERIRSKYPDVPMMLCAGGGSRVDYGALKYFTEFWPSDNTNPYDRIFMQWEYSNYFPAIAVDNHVTDMGKQSIKFKTDVAFMGKLGFDIKVEELNSNELSFVQHAVKRYDSLKELIWKGDLYRLQDPYQHKVASLSYLSAQKDIALVLNYYIPNTYTTTIAKPIKMQGLDPKKKYKIEEINLATGEQSPIDSSTLYSGDFLLTVGFNPLVSAKRSSVLLLLRAEQ
ncbi:alpha-galactosidase [Sphingobacterium sp.]|uniref:alpha-galactosidase n=1 Tax=Sphingobacterium sp. TaxID=341027 RepID=UPI0031D308CB